MIGDRRFDVEGARAMKVESVGVTYGYGSMEELVEAHADYIVETQQSKKIVHGPLPAQMAQGHAPLGFPDHRQGRGNQGQPRCGKGQGAHDTAQIARIAQLPGSCLPVVKPMPQAARELSSCSVVRRLRRAGAESAV